MIIIMYKMSHFKSCTEIFQYLKKKYFRQKLFRSKGTTDLILGGVVSHVKVTSIFLNGSPYFLFQNLITDSKSFSKHYNEIYFH